MPRPTDHVLRLHNPADEPGLARRYLPVRRQPEATEGRLPASGQQEAWLAPSSIPIAALRWLCQSIPAIRIFRVTGSLSLLGHKAGSLYQVIDDPSVQNSEKCRTRTERT